MQPEGKPILIICYSFPPLPGIGGRRWAKFAKYLAQKDYKIHVMCSRNPFKEQSLWTKDIENSNIKVYPLPVRYPEVILNGVKNFFDKLKYRLWKIYLSWYSKGVVFERTMFWEKQMIKKASQLIEKENIKNVIVSIPPYRLATYSIKLKQKYPQINLIIDYRDPWTDNKSFHGFKNISSSRYNYERKLENDVLKSADTIVSVSRQMSEDLIKHDIRAAKVITLPNGFDPSDIVQLNNVSDTKDKIRFVYAGTLYNDLEYVILPLLEYLNKLKEINKALYNRFSFEFYGSINKELKNKLNDSRNECIIIHDAVPLGEMQKILKKSTFCVLITPPDYSVVFNTKFCEYLANRKPILLFAYPCEASGFLTENRLGFHINPANIEKELNLFFGSIENTLANFNNNFNIEPFSIPFLTTELEKLLK